MNRAGASKFIPDTHPTQTRHSIEDRVDRVYNEWMAEQWENHVSLSRDDGGSSRSQGAQVVFGGGGGGKGDKRTMGYVTKDACPGIGDDIDHVPGTSPSLSLSPISSHPLLHLLHSPCPFTDPGPASATLHRER